MLLSLPAGHQHMFGLAPKPFISIQDILNLPCNFDLQSWRHAVSPLATTSSGGSCRPLGV
eukprot:11797555-Prorocentrum_lima.AAC.1